MKRKIVHFTWEDEDAQAAFAEWCPSPDASATSGEVDQIESFMGLAPPLRVLDVGCGNGRHSIELARRGYQVVGIDVAKRFLAEAEDHLASSGLHVEFRLQRASELQESGVYDFAFAYWHTIGFMNNVEIDRHFSAVCRALKPGASFLYVFQGPRLIPGREGDEPTRNWREEDGKFILSRKTFRNGHRDEYCVVIDTNAGDVIEYEEHQKAIGYEQLLDHLKSAGFCSVQAYKDFERNPASAEDFSVFVCQKK